MNAVSASVRAGRAHFAQQTVRAFASVAVEPEPSVAAQVGFVTVALYRYEEIPVGEFTVVQVEVAATTFGSFMQLTSE